MREDEKSLYLLRLQDKTDLLSPEFVEALVGIPLLSICCTSEPAQAGMCKRHDLEPNCSKMKYRDDTA